MSFKFSTPAGVAELMPKPSATPAGVEIRASLNSGGRSLALAPPATVRVASGDFCGESPFQFSIFNSPPGTGRWALATESRPRRPWRRRRPDRHHRRPFDRRVQRLRDARLRRSGARSRASSDRAAARPRGTRRRRTRPGTSSPARFSLRATARTQSASSRPARSMMARATASPSSAACMTSFR